MTLSVKVSVKVQAKVQATHLMSPRRVRVRHEAKAEGDLQVSCVDGGRPQDQQDQAMQPRPFLGQKWGFLLRLTDHRAGFWQTTPPNKQAWFRVTLADALD